MIREGVTLFKKWICSLHPISLHVSFYLCPFICINHIIRGILTLLSNYFRKDHVEYGYSSLSLPPPPHSRTTEESNIFLIGCQVRCKCGREGDEAQAGADVSGYRSGRGAMHSGRSVTDAGRNGGVKNTDQNRGMMPGVGIEIGHNDIYVCSSTCAYMEVWNLHHVMEVGIHKCAKDACVCMWLSDYMHTDTLHTYMHTYMHTNIHTCIHTHV